MYRTFQPPSTFTETLSPVNLQDIYSISLEDILRYTPLRSILAPKTLLMVNARENVASLLTRLRNSALRCAIVFDSDQLFVGFVDAMDIAVHVLNVINWSPNITEESFRDLDWQGQRFSTELSGSLMNASNSDPFQTVTPDVPLRDVLDRMSTGIHRLAVIENGTIVNVISQWDILLVLMSRLSFLGKSFQKTVADSGLGTAAVETLVSNQNASVSDTLRFMYDNQITGVPLVDDSGKIVLNFSLTDLLCLTPQNFPNLALSCQEYLFRSYGYVKPPICCRRSDTIENLLLKFAAFGVHRVYVIDDKMIPTGVITLTDVCKMLLSSTFLETTQ